MSYLMSHASLCCASSRGFGFQRLRGLLSSWLGILTLEKLRVKEVASFMQKSDWLKHQFENSPNDTNLKTRQCQRNWQKCQTRNHYFSWASPQCRPWLAVLKAGRLGFPRNAICSGSRESSLCDVCLAKCVCRFSKIHTLEVVILRHCEN